jgi:RNA polymerase sigma factor (sigma-70 family)
VAAAGDVDAYVYRVLVNCVSTARSRRSNGEMPTVDDPEGSADEFSDQLALGASVRDPLDRMSVAHREMVLLRYFADVTHTQMAAVLAIRIGTVKSRLAGALDHLSLDPLLAGLSGKENTP